MIPSVYSVQQEVGAGLLLAANAVRALDELGLSEALGRVGQLENPILCRLRDAALRAVPDRIQLRQFERVMLYKERSAIR